MVGPAALASDGLAHPLITFYVLNVLLFAFNLLPLHPLDGGGTGWAVETDHGTLGTRCIVNAAGVYPRVPILEITDEDWNFDEQPLTMKTMQISKTDQLFLRCQHDNNTDLPIAYGESSDTEMCAAGLYYTPFESLDGCTQQ